MPKISLIFYNFNNGLYLEHSLGSILSQTMRDIEVIVIDTGSTDDSMKILQESAAADPRIRLLELPPCQSPHSARKYALAVSSGQFVMFVNSGDFLVPNACEAAYKAASEGHHDIICFHINVIPQPGGDSEEADRIASRFNKTPAKTSGRDAIVQALCSASYGTPVVWNKLYRGQLAREAFGQMEKSAPADDYEKYELLALANAASSLLRLNQKLYNYRPWAISPDAGPSTLYSCNYGKQVIQDFCRKHGAEQYAETIFKESLQDDINSWLESVPPEQTTPYFNSIASKYGIMPIMDEFLLHFSSKVHQIADKFQHYATDERPKQPVKRVGIFYSIMMGGGAEAVITQLANLLAKDNYQVTVFLRYGYPADNKFAPEVRLLYLNPQLLVQGHSSRLYQLHNYLKNNPVDVMLFHDAWDPNLIWQIILLKYLHISQILFHHSSYVRALYKLNEYSLNEYYNIFKLLDNLVCLSSYAELFMRLNGIDAKFIANPIKQCSIQPEKDFCSRKKRIIMLGRLADPIKQPEEALKIFREILKSMPDVKLTFIGSFVDSKKREEFYATARKLEVADKIEVTGWTENPAVYIDQAALLLATSWSEAFPLAIGEAQARGLPVVMYSLAIELARDNKSIITVSQGDFKSAAREIVALLNDEPRWRRLSAIAAANAKKFTPEKYLENIKELLATVGTASELTRYHPEDYRVAMRMLAFYGAHLPPWLEQQTGK